MAAPPAARARSTSAPTRARSEVPAAAASRLGEPFAIGGDADDDADGRRRRRAGGVRGRGHQGIRERPPRRQIRGLARVAFVAGDLVAGARAAALGLASRRLHGELLGGPPPPPCRCAPPGRRRSDDRRRRCSAPSPSARRTLRPDAQCRSRWPGSPGDRALRAAPTARLPRRREPRPAPPRGRSWPSAPRCRSARGSRERPPSGRTFDLRGRPAGPPARGRGPPQRTPRAPPRRRPPG